MGSELQVDHVTALAFLNTDLAASFAAVNWLFIEWRFAKKPHFVGLLTGAVARLATITPAAGYVPVYARRSSALRPDWSVTRRSSSRTRSSGTTRSTSRSTDRARSSGSRSPPGLGCSRYAFVFTYAMLAVIDLITGSLAINPNGGSGPGECTVSVRTGEEAERGLDEAMHGESAYGLDPAM